MTNPFGLYIHIPFCVHKCSYCDFYSFTKYQETDFLPLAELLIKELDQTAGWLENRTLPPLTSIFFGGGTPSLFPPGLIARIKNRAVSLFGAREKVEVTLEANPETVTMDFLKGIREEAGVNRLSLGAQSFNEKHLKSLERRCGPEAIRRAVSLLKEAGFQRFSIDLIVGIPAQTKKEIVSDLDEAARLQPTHLSVYQLSLKPGHVLYSQLPDEDFCADIYPWVSQELQKRGFFQYEISNFSLPEQECHHNLLYWQGGDFLGIGPSASSRFFFDDIFIHRKHPSDVGQYTKSIAGERWKEFETSTHAQTVLEAAFLELRVNKGVSLARFKDRYRYDLMAAKKMNLMLSEGMLKREGDRLYFLDRGRLLADSVSRDLVDL